MLELEGVRIRQGGFRLGPLDLRVEPGACLALMGPSGAGKTTLLQAILGLLPTEAGRVLVGGQDQGALPVEARGIGYLPQRLGLFPHLRVRENIDYGLRRRGDGDEALRARLIEVTGLGPLLDRRPDQLSGGEGQRVALVRALLVRPRLLLLDEPFSSLDPGLREELWWLLDELRRAQEMSTILVTHDLGEARVLAQGLAVLVDGRLVERGGLEAVRARPASEAGARFLGFRNLLPLVDEGGGRLRCPALAIEVDAPAADTADWRLCLPAGAIELVEVERAGLRGALRGCQRRGEGWRARVALATGDELEVEAAQPVAPGPVGLRVDAARAFVVQAG